MPAEAKKKLTTVAVRLEEDAHWAWKRAAAKRGMSLTQFVTLAVESAIRSGTLQAQPRAPRSAEVRRELPSVDPAKCTARRHAGAYCRKCGAIHTKGL